MKNWTTMSDKSGHGTLNFINRSISIVRNICYSYIDFSQLLLIYVPRFWVGYITCKQIPMKVSVVSAMYSLWDCMIVWDLEIFANKWQHIHIRLSEPVFFLFFFLFFRVSEETKADGKLGVWWRSILLIKAVVFRKESLWQKFISCYNS